VRVGLVAGETSGDLLGAGLIRAIRARFPGATFEGVAGPEMCAAGCEQWEAADTLAVFGLIEPLAHIPRLLRLRRSLVRRWRQDPPDVFVGIDAPDFNLGLEKALRKSNIPTAHYVSPSIWVWREGRVKTVRKAADCVLCILPFEKRIYDRYGIDAVFVGHPKADSLPADVDVRAAREKLGLGSGRIVAVLPGSRVSEVKRLGPYFASAAELITRDLDDVRFVTPIATPRLRPVFEAELAGKGLADRFTLVEGSSIDVMAAADVVLLASGTAALESALLTKPTVAAYKIAGLSALLVRLIGLRNRYFTIPNLVADEALIPEFIQEQVTPEALAGATLALLNDPTRRAWLQGRFATLRAELALGADERAADAVIKLAG